MLPVKRGVRGSIGMQFTEERDHWSGSLASNQPLPSAEVHSTLLRNPQQNASHFQQLYFRSGSQNMQIHQGSFVAEVQPIKNKGTLQTAHFRIRAVQLFPAERLIAESIATDARTGYKRAEAKLRELLGCEQMLKQAA